jgi:UDP-N-acetylmuramyl pentapeptide phosphotransferase/UDP-N-acetylglucosamine-1-phosphate transferase
MIAKPLIFVLIATISYFAVILIRAWLLRSDVVDIPNLRSAHSIPTPRGGGLAIVLLTLTTVLVISFINHQWRQSLVFMTMGAVIAWLGWRDDVKSLSPKLRLLVQAIVAVISILGLGFFQWLTIPFVGKFYIGWIGVPLTILWIVGITNAYNFMDGLDGFAGGVAVAAGFGWMLLSSSNSVFHNDLGFWIALAIAASSLGFLFHNWPPAKIFMGDVASTFLGYSFAVLPLFAVKASAGDAAMAGVVIMWTFILDAGLTFARRAIKKEKILLAHRSHLYQRLNIIGLRSLWIDILFIGLTILGVLLLLGWMENISWIPAVILFGLPGCWFFLSMIMKRLENEK